MGGRAIANWRETNRARDGPMGHMRSKVALGIIAAIVVSLVIFVEMESKRGASPSASGPASKGAASAAAASDAAIPTRPSRFETLKERRARMISEKAYRDDFKLSEHDV